jgi:hypothetical protein
MREDGACFGFAGIRDQLVRLLLPMHNGETKFQTVSDESGLSF